MNQILSNLDFSPDKAGIFFNQNRYILIRPETLVRFQKAVEEKIGGDISELMFGSVIDIGERIGRGYMAKPELSQRQIITAMLDTVYQLGWVKLDLKESEAFPEKIVLEGVNSAFALAYGRSQTPVCHIVRGIFCGALSQIVGSVEESRESECQAMGHPKCIFTFKSKKESSR